jgi:hypothetical protein
MKFYILPVLLLLLSPFQVFSQQEAIQINFTDNSTISFLLDDVQKLDFTEDQMRLHQSDGMVLSWDFDFINYYTYIEETVTENKSVQAKSLDMKVYPNPALYDLRVSFDILDKQDARLSVMSLDGKIMESRVLQGASKGNVLIDISAYPAGQYILGLEGTTFKLSKSFIKN